MVRFLLWSALLEAASGSANLWAFWFNDGSLLNFGVGVVNCVLAIVLFDKVAREVAW
jgi:hypothetical protein